MSKPALPCCGTFADTGEHTEGCRTPVFERMAKERRQRREKLPNIRWWQTITWECRTCGEGVIGAEDLTEAKEHVCEQ